MPLNHIMKVFSILFFATLMLTSCQFDPKPFSFSNNAYIAGEIINPKSDNVILYTNGGAADTIALKADNTFKYLIKDVHPGLYSFRHSNQRQNIFIEPKDSILIRLNTFAFDESLAFSGKGGEKNSFLIDMFLFNEENDRKLPNLLDLNPDEFESIAQELKEKSSSKLKRLLRKKMYSSDFKYVAQKAIDYENYDLKERFYYLTLKYNSTLKSQLNEDFFKFREEVNFNDEKLDKYYGYLRYLDKFIKNKTIDRCLDENGQDCLVLKTTENTIRRLHITDSLLKLDNLRTVFLQGVSSTGIITADSPENLNKVLKVVDNIDMPSDVKDNLIQAALLQNQYLSRSTIADRQLFSAHKKDTLSLKDIVKKPTIVFSWTLDQPERHSLYHKRLENLSKKYLNIDFLAINVDTAHYEEWLQIIETNAYNPKQEYRLLSFKEIPEKLKERTGLVLVINKDCKVIDRSINFLDSEFEVFLDQL